MGTSLSQRKSFEISKWEVWQAYQRVKANKGAPGTDGVSIEEFETDLQGNLYKVWNRMSSGSYFAPPVRAVPIPKPDGGVRVLGVPTVADRIAQTVVASRLEAKVEPMFHPDSYGYRPGRSALDAVAVTRQRCWSKDWVLDLDIRAFFDSVDHDLLIKAVQANTDDAWVVLYVRRWLTAPMVHPDGSVQDRGRGTPQGSAVSPVLANLFLHYAFDAWMAREFPAVTFERYVDDVVVHAATHGHAERLRSAIAARMVEVGCSCTRTRPGSCTARTTNGAAPMCTRRSRSSGTPSAPARPAASTGGCSPRSCPRSPGRPWSRWAGRSAGGASTCASARTWLTSPGG